MRGAPKTDLLAPAGRRFANFVFAIFRLGANAGARAFAAKLVRPPRRGRALDYQTDPLAPAAGRRRRFLVFGLGANAGVRAIGVYADDDAASRPLSYGVSPKPAALKDQRYRRRVNLVAPNPRACA